jgi:hypothetical protein
MSSSLRVLALAFIATIVIVGAVVASTGAIARFGSDGYQAPIVGP